MITTIILARHGAEALMATLSSLIPGVAEGLLADAVVVAEAGDDVSTKVAEAAGAAWLVLSEGGDPWLAGAGLARRDWLLCLHAGDLPRDGWITGLERFLAARPAARLARLDRTRMSVPERVLRWRDRALGTGGPRAGDLVHRHLLGGAWPSGLRPVRLEAGLERLAV